MNVFIAIEHFRRVTMIKINGLTDDGVQRRCVAQEMQGWRVVGSSVGNLSVADEFLRDFWANVG